MGIFLLRIVIVVTARANGVELPLVLLTLFCKIPHEPIVEVGQVDAPTPTGLEVVAEVFQPVLTILAKIPLASTTPRVPADHRPVTLITTGIQTGSLIQTVQTTLPSLVVPEVVKVAKILGRGLVHE
jgi:hypothetical protein